MSPKRAWTFGIAVALVAALVGPARAEPEDALDTLRRVTAESLTIPAQAEALARLAWPDEGRTEPLLAAAARDWLVRFGHKGLAAMRQSLPRVAPLYTADITAAFIDARWSVPAGEPEDYLPGLVDALWFGSVEAQRLAMIEVSRFTFPAAVTGIIDAVHAHPELTRVAIQSLGRMQDIRGRLFLNDVLTGPNPRYRAQAAEALVALGSPGLDLLRDALRSAEPTVRRAALAALLPNARPEDLTALYEYMVAHESEDPEQAEGIRPRASELEEKAAAGQDPPDS